AGVTEDGTTDYPTTAGAFDVTHSTASPNDAFVTKLELPGDQHLPVELTGFGLSAANTAVHLVWRTASETQNAGFEVQRATGDDGDFKPVASYLTHPALAGLGTSPSGKEYSLVDGDLQPGLYRYRLVDISTDGIRTEHPAKSIRIEAEAETPLELMALRLL